ncbi:MAG: hypothetical protein IJO63_03590 [Bacilli bacterium]|nr:hypothetical protein [Bacilli bacterium]
MYKLISGISFLIRAWLCYNTIDNIPILANPIANSILLEVISLYTILVLISRKIVGIFYKAGDAPTFGAILYFFVYLINLGIMYIIMILLTKIGILPI